MKQAIKVRNVNQSGQTSMDDVDTINLFCDQADRVIEGWQLLRDLTATLENVMAHHSRRMPSEDVRTRCALVERARAFLEPDEEKVPAGATHRDPDGYYWAIPREGDEDGTGEFWTEDGWRTSEISGAFMHFLEEL